MTTLTERVETAVSTMETAAANAPAHIQIMQDLQTSVEQTAAANLQALADLRLYTAATWVSGQTYADRRVVFNDGGTHYIPMADGYTAGASVAADVIAGLLIVQQGLTQSDIQPNPEDTDPTKLLVPGSFGNGLDANGLQILSTAAQWQKPSGSLALLSDQTAGLPVGSVCYANWLARSDASNGYAVEIMVRDTGAKYLLTKPDGAAPVPGDWVALPTHAELQSKADLSTADFTGAVTINNGETVKTDSFKTTTLWEGSVLYQLLETVHGNGVLDEGWYFVAWSLAFDDVDYFKNCFCIAPGTRPKNLNVPVITTPTHTAYLLLGPNGDLTLNQLDDDGYGGNISVDSLYIRGLYKII